MFYTRHVDHVSRQGPLWVAHVGTVLTIALYMPLHASYILQLLNVGCFAPLKQAYKKEIRGLVDSYINYINKRTFLATFLAVYNKAILKSNILLSF
jgi:hypothetical protein